MYHCSNHGFYFSDDWAGSSSDWFFVSPVWQHSLAARVCRNVWRDRESNSDMLRNPWDNWILQRHSKENIDSRSQRGSIFDSIAIYISSWRHNSKLTPTIKEWPEGSLQAHTECQFLNHGYFLIYNECIVMPPVPLALFTPAVFISCRYLTSVTFLKTRFPCPTFLLMTRLNVITEQRKSIPRRKLFLLLNMEQWEIAFCLKRHMGERWWWCVKLHNLN